jgi:hypothetical protein
LAWEPRSIRYWRGRQWPTIDPKRFDRQLSLDINVFARTSPPAMSWINQQIRANRHCVELKLNSEGHPDVVLYHGGLRRPEWRR